MDMVHVMGKVRIGVSGWNYDGWEGDFYPSDLSRDDRLSYLAERFDTVEANGSFYSLLSPSTYRDWYDSTPRGFRMAVKGSRFITHNKKLADARGPLANFFASGVLELEEKTGPVLWQLSGNLTFDPDRVRRFLELLPKDFHEASELAREHDHRVEEARVEVEENHRIRHVLEARHQSFFTDEAVRVLRDAGVALAVSHSGDWPLVEETTAGFVYVRLHGSPETYHSGYHDEELDGWARKIRAWRAAEEPDDAARVTDREPPVRKERDVWVYFDNDAEGRAPHDARALMERLG